MTLGVELEVGLYLLLAICLLGIFSFTLTCKESQTGTFLAEKDNLNKRQFEVFALNYTGYIF